MGFVGCGFNTRMEAIGAHGAPRLCVGFVGSGLRPVTCVSGARVGGAIGVVGVCEAVDQIGEVGEARVFGEELAFGGFESRDLGVELCEARVRAGDGAVRTRGLLRVLLAFRGGLCFGGCGGCGDHAPVVPRR